MQHKDQQSAIDCYAELASKYAKSILIDVRSSKEWYDDGVPDLSSGSHKLVLCEWRKYPLMELNKKFFFELEKKIDFKKVKNLYFICAAGIRSQEAASYSKKKLIEQGFDIECINVSDGFTGNKNGFFSFGKISGWKASGLPFSVLKQPTYEN